MTGTTVGILGVQGDVREHAAMLDGLGVTPLLVRRPAELSNLDALVIPGGESTTMDKLCRAFGLTEPVRDLIAHGLPVYGSCAGMIMLASSLLGGREDQESFGGIDMTVRRNAFGRQVDSFEADLSITGVVESDRPFRAVFIRAPWVEAIGPDVEVLATVERDGAARPVAVRQGNVLATSFHPEVTGDDRVHRLFVERVLSRAKG